jgi:class 3 adenylate cyclase
LSKPKQTGERRHITILFCDLVDSVGLSTRLDPEDLMEIRAAYYELARSIIGSFNGFIYELLGDGVSALFGSPCVTKEVHSV